MSRNTKYLQRYSDILEELAENHNLKKKDVEDVVDRFFLTMKKSITDWRMPTIKLTNFGTFKPKIGKINFVLKTTFRYFRDGKNSRDKVVNKIKQVWSVKQRLIKEDLGQETWKDWRNKEEDAQK